MAHPHAAHADAELLDLLRRSSSVRGVISPPRGSWRPPERRRGVAWLVLRGVLARKVWVASACCSEIIGSGDIIRPWEPAEVDSIVETRTEWSVIEDALLVALAPAAETAADAELFAALSVRALARVQRLSVQVAIAAQVGVGRRVVLTFRHLGDRWGRVTPDGLHVPVRLSHLDLAQLVSARRTTVSTALSELAADDVVTRLPDRTWLVRDDASA